VPDIPAPPDVAAVPADAERSKSGLAWKVLQKGEGDRRRFWIPGKLADSEPKGDDPDAQSGLPKRPLVFDIELLSLQGGPRPAQRRRQDSQERQKDRFRPGLARARGGGGRGASDRDEYRDRPWTTEGEIIESSIVRGKPATFRLDQVIRGSTEGLELMVVGEKRRLWIPESLAYAGQPGNPQVMLVFGLELLDIIK
jgi:peptidylprolyl isomerase